MTEVPECAVAIMAKAPLPGKVKTRLCPPLSYEEAAQLYSCFLLDKIAQVRALEETGRAIAYTPEEGKAFFDTLALSDFIFIRQDGADLGARLASTLGRLLEMGYSKVMAIDSDTPTLPLDYIQRAVILMREPDADLVLGPCEDGGYYLIALHKVHRELFEGMAWSTSQVFTETMRRAQLRRLQVACLPTWYDVDTPDDLDRLKAELDLDGASAAQYTKRFLIEHQK